MGMKKRGEPLPREFYMSRAHLAAPKLLGKLLVHNTPQGMTAGRIVEVEAYEGPEDLGAHSRGGIRSERTKIQYGTGGYAYMFRIYGMHTCFNVVIGEREKPHAILVRALAPEAGLELMKKRRNTQDPVSLCNGPGKLCQAMGLTMEQYGWDLCGERLYIAFWDEIEPEQIMVSPRINIDYAGAYKDILWRYYLKEEPCVSKVASGYRKKSRPMIWQSRQEP